MNGIRLFTLMPRFLTAFILLAASFAQGAVIYSGIQDISVPFSPDGVYLNIATGATTTSQPGDWNSAPWINPFFGGTVLATDSLLRPVITGADQVVNLPSGALVDASNAFASGESGSVSHVGSRSNQFQLGTPGYIGFVFEAAPGGVSHYGWLNLVIRNGDAGTIHDWAYDDTPGAAILVGNDGAVPEPSRTILLGIGLLWLLRRTSRRR